MGSVKMPLQDKVADLESRVQTLEKKMGRLDRFTLLEDDLIPLEARAYWDNIWKHFDEGFADMRQFFKKTFRRKV